MGERDNLQYDEVFSMSHHFLYPHGAQSSLYLKGGMLTEASKKLDAKK